MAVEISRVFLNEMAALASKRRVGSWTYPLRLVSVQTFLGHIINFVGNVYMGAMSLEKFQHIYFLQSMTIGGASFTA